MLFTKEKASCGGDFPLPKGGEAAGAPLGKCSGHFKSTEPGSSRRTELVHLGRFEFGSDGSYEKRKKIQDFRGFSAPAWELSIPGTFAHSATVTALQKKNGADLN